MKTLLLLAALAAVTAVTAVTACDRRTSPTENGARAVTGIVELRFGTPAERSDPRVERTHQGFASPPTPTGGGHPPAPRPPGPPLGRPAARHPRPGTGGAAPRPPPPPPGGGPSVVPRKPRLISTPGSLPRRIGGTRKPPCPAAPSRRSWMPRGGSTKPQARSAQPAGGWS